MPVDIGCKRWLRFAKTPSLASQPCEKIIIWPDRCAIMAGIVGVTSLLGGSDWRHDEGVVEPLPGEGDLADLSVSPAPVRPVSASAVRKSPARIRP